MAVKIIVQVFIVPCTAKQRLNFRVVHFRWRPSSKGLHVCGLGCWDFDYCVVSVTFDVIRVVLYVQKRVAGSCKI
jgi:hypothetical protein